MSTAPAMENLTAAQLDQLSVNTIRTLSMDAVQAANSGHPGTPMALAPLVYTIWNRVLRFDPKNPIWLNRDRFSGILREPDRKLPRQCPACGMTVRVAIEPASTLGWKRYVTHGPNLSGWKPSAHRGRRRRCKRSWDSNRTALV